MEQIFSLAELELKLGEDIKTLRLQKNQARQSLCDQAGISLNALKNLENGDGATIKTLIKVMRALGRLDWLHTIAPRVSINPLHVGRGKPKRQRAHRSR